MIVRGQSQSHLPRKPIEATVSVPLVYMAHPVSPRGCRETVEINLAAAKQWLKRLAERYPFMCFIAPWITECEIWDDSVPEERATGLARCDIVIARCDELWMVGPRVSDGMSGEMAVAHRHGLAVRDFTRWEMQE